MYTPENRARDDRRVEAAFADFVPRPAVQRAAPPPLALPRACSVREAIFAPHELVPTAQALGRVCGAPTVACPPAVPVVVSGERMTQEAVCALEAYGIEQVEVCVRREA